MFSADFFKSASYLEIAFWCSAIAGTLFLFLRVVLMLAGSDIDHGDGLDTDMHHIGDDMSSESDAAFEVISIHSITAFFMMFGWIGLSCLKQFGLSSALSILWAFIAGFSCMLLTALLFKAAKRLVSQGSKFSIESTIGKNASVYQTIPDKGKGKIQLSLSGQMTRELDAISENGKQIESFQIVTITKVIDAYTVAVKATSPKNLKKEENKI